MPNTTRRYRFRRILLGATALLLLGAGAFVFYVYLNYESIVRSKIEQALPETLSIDFGSLTVNPGAGHAAIDNLTVLYGHPGHTCRYHSMKIDRLEAHGIGIVSLIFRDRLVIDKITMQGGQLVIDNALLNDSTLKDSTIKPQTKETSAEGLTRIDIGAIQTDDLNLLVKGDSLNVCSMLAGFHIRHLGIDLGNTPVKLTDVAYKIVSVGADSIRYNPEGGAYRYNVGGMRYENDSLQLIALSLKANHPKYEFAHHAGKQIDVFELEVDSVRIIRFPAPVPGDSVVEAERIVVVRPSLHVFRDRRMPFIKNHTEPLPMVRFQKLPLAVRVGAVDIVDARIVYEEFPEEGTQSGSIAFDHLYAHFEGVDNREKEFNRFINLDVNTRFMKSGHLKARFAFPKNPRNHYYAEGTLDNMELTQLNPTLENLAKVRIESGRMNTMHFNFDYDDDVSNGSIMMLYENLEMMALKEKDNVEEKDGLKSFFLNVLFARKNKNDEVRTAKRDGTISFERDKKRSIFNYWWKSLATGIKSGNSINEILDGGR
ncbi:MAG TPA: DUF748 domain-containing protein [Cyclobacteriaceae bacterium]